MVSSRSKTAAEAAANRRTTRSKSGGVALTSLPSLDSKSVTTKSPASKKPQSKAGSISKGKATARQKKDAEFCICNGGDDGSPMIKCEGSCKNWYHFTCVDLSEDDAGEIEKYICTNCEARTGLKTILDFEGADAMVEDDSRPPEKVDTLTKRVVAKEDMEDKEDVESVEESEIDGSDDDFVEEPESRKAQSGKRITRRLSFSDKSESDSDVSDDDGKRSRRKSRATGVKRIRRAAASKSPAPESSSAGLKRRNSAAAQQSTMKRARTSEVRESASDDPVRKYCIAKLEEIIKPMFFEYPTSVGEPVEAEVDDKVEKERQPKRVEDLTEEEKERISQKVSQFVAELEHCMMDTYAEPDKSGKQSAGGKYKERFRMLSFNLPKPDRVQLRQGIASGRISPQQLNVMSSTDLANEHLKHEIEVAEKEALQHSILQKITAPRAKITHKGLETIEDHSERQRAEDVVKEEEEDRRMEMEKRERERLSRLRQPSISEAPTTPIEPSPMSAAPLPASPTQGRSVSWGAPPTLPVHALHGQSQSDSTSLPSPVSSTRLSRSLFPSLGNDYMTTMEDGLNLSDLINIDDEGSNAEPISSASVPTIPDAPSASAAPEIATPSGPSPFTTTKPSESERRASFDLNALWTGEGGNPQGQAEESTDRERSEGIEHADSPQEMADEAMDLESGDENDDFALDAILQQSGSAPKTQGFRPEPKPEIKSEVIDELPRVWSGELSMPVDANTNLTPNVITRQIGGRELEPYSGYWQTLFPHTQARIDGRVPTASSTQYLVTTRMNPTKELIAVCFTPSADEDRSRFEELINFLISKDRHALVFPWGAQPKPHAPGRELYIVPLLRESPVPEFIELLDNHHLPENRNSNILIGVFVLNKGRLAASTPPPLPAVASTSTTPQALGIPPLPIVAPAPLGLASTPVPPTIPATNLIPANVDPASLSAEIASLTPDQIQLLLQHLGQTSQPSTFAPPPASVTPSMAPPPQPSFPMHPYPPYPPYQQSPPHPPRHDSPPYHDSPSYSANYDHDGYSNRQSRGSRGRGRGFDRGRRGRGRGKFHDDKDNGHYRDSDSGWNKGRGRGHDNPTYARRNRTGD